MLTCCVLSVVIGGLLWSRKQANQHANKLLASLLFIYAYIYFVTVLITDGGIVYVPHLFRTAAPLNYLIGPLIFLYVRASLLSATRPHYRRYAWLFLPALLNIIEFIPFYAQSATYKLDRLQSLATVHNSLFTIREGLLPPQFHLIGYSLSSLIYSLLAARLWWRYRRQEGQNPHSNPVFANWLSTFVLVHVSVNLVWVIEMPFVRYIGFGNLTMNITYTIAQLTICLYILRRPALLYGAYTLSRPEPARTPIEPPTIIPADRSVIQDQDLMASADPAELERDIQDKLRQLEQYMASQQPYLQPRLSLADVSVATRIPPYLLSAMLNRVLGLDFRDYVNAHRVRHLCQLLEGNKYAHLTLEGISTQAGFSSKTTFYRAFQKHTGVTPAQYLLNSDLSNN
ncbi:helix-turn-helix transcriptional regulator [Fibrella aquatilis]|uniref:Helix-turn-helix transcriptional regulator n=1 Tax=Fibrella aquatilis TaxID=2817059 RepID=A0A939GC83_9BACT|nr:helix-turn-helix transcriptional regulator [Fibrella aquatilis]MBO0933723.1 helix-turn-helix transcriptional regulator [Fibrella aquatilis]